MFIKEYNEKDYNDDFDDNISYYDNDYITDFKDYTDVNEKSIDFAEALYDIIQSIVDNEEEGLEEEFTSITNAQIHFNEHCIDNSNKKSTKATVLYDFNNIDDYIAREDVIDRLIKSSKNNIYDLTDTSEIIEYFRKLFKGNQTINFDTSCKFYNSKGRVSISIHSWATDATTNYMYNTVDFVIQTPSGKTITLFPVDANYLEKEFNKQLTRCGFAVIHFNH